MPEIGNSTDRFRKKDCIQKHREDTEFMNAISKRSDSERSGQIQSVARAISVLNALAADEDGMTLTQIAHTVTLPPSTVHRLLTTLQQERYVRFDTERGAWQIGVQCFAVGTRSCARATWWRLPGPICGV